MKQAQICHLEKSSKADLLNNYRIFLESQAENEKILYVIQHNFVFLQKVRPFTIRMVDIFSYISFSIFLMILSLASLMVARSNDCK